MTSVAAQESPAETEPRITECRIGFDGYYKVGYWTPIWVDVAGGVPGESLRVEVTTQDNDGIDVTVPHTMTADDESASGIRSTVVFIQVGRLASPIQVVLLADDGRLLDRHTLQPGRGNGEIPPCTALPATSELIVHLGGIEIGLAAAMADRDAGDGAFDRYVARVTDLEALPTEWLGYDGVDVVVLTTGDPGLAERLAGDERRFAALRRWIDLGGRLVIGCGQNSPQLLAADRPLAQLLPGKFAELLRLPQTRTLESFAANATAIGAGPVPVTIPVPRLTEVRGQVALYGQGDNLPLVVRAAQGFGEVTFVGLDFDLTPLAEWSGRPDFLQAVLRPLLGRIDVGKRSQTLASSGYDDLAGALRQRLGRTFVGVMVVTFPIVATAIIAYLLLVGPLDYLFIHELLRRPWVAWITFPLVVLLTTGLAMWWTRVAKEPGGERLNTLELVDFDPSTGLVRGTCWATFYSPHAARYDLQIDPRLPNGDPAAAAASQLSSWGLPGSGLGGMHAGGLGLDVVQNGYRMSPTLEVLEGVPILTASTKSFLARWQRPAIQSAPPLWDAKLSEDDDGLVVGTLTNLTGVTLSDACLLHGKWGYTLGNVRPGQRIDLDPQRNVNLTKTIILRRARRSLATHNFDPDRELFLADRASLEELVNVMMFYEAAGGYDFVGLPNRYQSFCDLSRLLDLNRAVLVADGTSAGSRWVDEQQATTKVVYRFVFTVDNEPQTTDN